MIDGIIIGAAVIVAAVIFVRAMRRDLPAAAEAAVAKNIDRYAEEIGAAAEKVVFKNMDTIAQKAVEATCDKQMAVVEKMMRFNTVLLSQVALVQNAAASMILEIVEDEAGNIAKEGTWAEPRSLITYAPRLQALASSLDAFVSAGFNIKLGDQAADLRVFAARLRSPLTPFEASRVVVEARRIRNQVLDPKNLY